jgi:hypothetical protein
LQFVIRKAEPVGSPNRGIKFDGSVEPQGTEDYRSVGYTLNVRLCGVDIGTHSRLETGDLKVNSALKISEEFRLPPYLLQAIEAQRAGGDVSVTAQLTILAVSSPKGGFNVGNIQAFGVGGQDPPFEITQQKWAKLTEGMGASTYAVLEIPLPTGPVPSPLSTAATRLDEARALLAEGKTDAVVTSCRKVMEALNPVVSVTKTATPGPPFQRMETSIAAKIVVGSPGQAGKDPKSERLESIRSAVWEMLHIGPHEGYVVSPEDARALFLFTSGLLRYYADLIARP